MDSIKSHINQFIYYEQLMIDKHDTTVEAMRRIFENIRVVDHEYCSYLRQCNQGLSNIENTIQMLKGIIHLSNGCVITDEVKIHLDENFTELNDLSYSMNKVVFYGMGFDYVVVNDEIS